jgi:5-methylcytosine-specific restriction endonuclease McrA
VSALPECTCEKSIALCKRHGLERDLSKSAKPQRRKARRAPRAQSLKQALSESKWSGIKDVLLELDPHCKVCGVKGDASTLDLDHIVPRSQGGPNRASNGQLLCREHHAEKHGKLEWTRRTP